MTNTIQVQFPITLQLGFYPNHNSIGGSFSASQNSETRSITAQYNSTTILGWKSLFKHMKITIQPLSILQGEAQKMLPHFMLL